MEGRRITKLQSCIFGRGFGGGGQAAAVAATERGRGERGSERLFETVENVDLSVFLLLPPPQGSPYYPRHHVPVSVRPRPTSPFLHVHKGPDKIQ